MKVLFVTNLPSPYRVDFFNEIGKSIDLTVCFERKTAGDRNDKWRNDSKRFFKEVYLNSLKIKNDLSISVGVVKEIKNKYDYIILSGISSPTIMIAILYCQLKGINYIVEDDGGLKKQHRERFYYLKKILLRKVYAYFTTTNDNIEVIKSLGVGSSRIFKYPFSSVKNNDILYNNMLQNRKKDIDEKVIILSIGQFIHRKGFDVLLKSFSMISNNNCTLYIVGGKPTDEYEEIIKKYNIKNIKFVDFKEKDELKRYYIQADLFVLPTREDVWGLVVNEALSYGLPVITTNKCGAGLELIKNFENGFLVESENVEELANKIELVVNDANLRNNMSINAIETIKNYTIETMSCWHLDILKKFEYISKENE